MPVLSMLQPAKLATPEEAFVGLAVQVRVAPAGVVMVRVTGALLVVTVLAPASWTATTGWMAKTLPAVVEPEGVAVKASLVAGPTVMVKLALTALVSPAAVAVSV